MKKFISKVKKVTSNFFTNKSAFSLIELIVVIAIMAVMAAVLAPALLGYVERSRAQKDSSGMDEVVNSIQLSLADQDVYDEMLLYSAEQYSCYVDSDSPDEANKVDIKSGKYYMYSDEERQLDETVYKLDGVMRGVTITFAPDAAASNSVTLDLIKGHVNKYLPSGKKTYGGLTGANASPKLADIPESELYNNLRATIGDKISISSQTYRNSEYTIFISMGTTGGQEAAQQDAIKVWGQFSGTNLPEGSSVAGNTSTGSNEFKEPANSGGNTPSIPAYEPLIIGDKVPENGIYYRAPQNSSLTTYDGIQYQCKNNHFSEWFLYYESCPRCGYEMDYNKLTYGASIPTTPSNGDILLYGDYEYVYQESGYGPFYDSNESGWTVNRITTGTKSPGKIVSYINGNPVVSFYCTFETFDGTIPTIPITITDLGMSPDWKIQYEYYYEGTVAQWKSLDSNWWLWIELDENDNVISEPVVHCKDGDYKASENW